MLFIILLRYADGSLLKEVNKNPNNDPVTIISSSRNYRLLLLESKNVTDSTVMIFSHIALRNNMSDDLLILPAGKDNLNLFTVLFKQQNGDMVLDDTFGVYSTDHNDSLFNFVAAHSTKLLLVKDTVNRKQFEFLRKEFSQPKQKDLYLFASHPMAGHTFALPIRNTYLLFK